MSDNDRMTLGADVLPKSTRAIVGFVVFVVAIFTQIAPKAQVLGGLAGTVTDRTKSPLPGVRVTVTTADLQRNVVTDSDGRYQFADLPVGTYTAKAELAGFETAERNVVVTRGATSGLSFALQLGCVEEVQRVDMGLARALREATAIVQIRISESGRGESCPVTGVTSFCVCTEHVATANQVLKAAPPGVSLTTIRFLQEGAGRIADNGRSGAEKSYAPGQEYVAFLRWDSATNRFLRFNGPIYMFPVREGRVDFHRSDGPGLSNGMPVEAFSRALRVLLTASR